MNFIDIHTHNKQQKTTVTSIYNCYPKETYFSNCFSISMHPWFIEKVNLQEDLVQLESYCTNENCLAIGECGLDKVTQTSYQLQKQAFKIQIQISEQYKKPMIIHCVKSFQDILAFRKQMNAEQIWIFHGFQKSYQLAKQLLNSGCMLSFGEALVIKESVQKVFKRIPLEATFLETDNANISIEEVYKIAAKLKSITEQTLKYQMQENFKKTFKR